MGVRDDIKNTWNKQDSLGRLLLTILLTTVIFWILGVIYEPIIKWFSLPGDMFDMILQPWSIITYGFLHSGFWHLLYNILFLYLGARFFLNLFSTKQLYTLFFTGVILGGLLFVVVQNIFPNYVGPNPLIGASAGVYAVCVFVCAYAPETAVRLIFIDVKLKYLGIALGVLVIFGLVARYNTGGDLAHLGGLLLGYYSATKMRDGIDILSGFASIGDSFVNLFKSTGTKPKKSKMKTVYKSKSKKQKSSASTDDEKQQRIDSILDKISNSGYESLTKEEKDFLFKAGKE